MNANAKKARRDEVRGKRLAVTVADMPFWPTRYRR